MQHWKLTRTGSAVPDPTTYQSRSATFGAAVRNTKQATLLVVNDPEHGLGQYLLTPGGQSRNAEHVVTNAASAVGARHELADEMPDLDTSFVARMVANPDSNAARETQAGADPNQIAYYLSTALEPGCWVAVSLRLPRKAEVSHTRRWYDHRLGNSATHHSRAGEAVIASVWAGGDNKAAVESVIHGTVAAMPGFDVEVDARPPMSALPIIGLCALLGLGAWVGLQGTAPIGNWWGGLGLGLPVIGAVLAVLMVISVASLSLNPRSRFKRSIAKGIIPMPRTRATSPRKPQKERTDKEGNLQPARDGDYPLASDAFLVGPSVVLGLVSPHTGEATEAAVTKMRAVPVTLRNNIGPVIGTSGGHRVHISQADRFGGFGSFGKPGTGKTVVITNLFAYDTACRVRGRAGLPPAVPGDTGQFNTLIAFENKGRDGVGVYKRYADTFGDAMVVVEVADPSTPAIDMFPKHGTAAERAAYFVDSMVYAFGEQSVGTRSQSTLNQLVCAALLVTPEDIKQANEVLPQPIDPSSSVLELTDIFLCSRGEEMGIALATAMTSRLVSNPGDVELADALQRISPLYGPKVTSSQRRNLVEAPQNKLSMLLKAPSWWSRNRPRETWDDIINSHGSVVVNAGQSVSGASVDTTLTSVLLSMLTFGLQKAIERNCAGWGDEGIRSVSIYSDELSLLTGAGNSSVFQWLRNQGRSFGVRPSFATQIPEQLEPVLRSTVTGFSTFLWLGQDDPNVAQVAVGDLSADGSEWVVSDITTLEPYHGVVRASVNKQRQPSVPVKTMFYGGLAISNFISEQGLE